MGGTIVLIVAGVILGAMLVLWLLGERGRPLRRSTWKMMREAGPGDSSISALSMGTSMVAGSRSISMWS